MPTDGSPSPIPEPPTPSPFCHLHVHSHYTLLEATATPTRLVAAAKAAGMDAVALTDRGNLFGMFEFAAAAKEAGIKPIVGCQVNLAPLGMQEKTRDMHQLVLLAESEQGYRNLAKLVSVGWLQGFYFEPRVDLEAIARHAAGLICLTGAGRDGFLNRHLLVGADDEARRQLGLLKDVFADRLWIEVTDHGVDGPVSALAGSRALAAATGVPLVATNWVHYLAPEDAAVHDVQLAIQKVTTLADTRRRRMPSNEYWLKDAAAMQRLFAELPEAVAATRAIAERCAKSVIPTGAYHLPTFACPAGLSEDAHLRALCERGLAARYGDDPAEDILARLAFELDTIVRMGFAAYFLIVADFIGWAKSRGIPVGPGRGSAAGSLVSYCLGITDLCPLRYGLLFERFLNPGRKSMPDIDIDFCKDRRGEVIEYVAGKYGHDAVTQIMTLGTMKARMAIKDVARAYEWTPEESQELANFIPEDPSGKHTLAVCLGLKPLDQEKNLFDAVEGLAKRYESDPRSKQVIDTALRLEGLGRSIGVHACGVIIAPGAVSDHVPVCNVKGKPATQYNMSQVEKCGLLKMDFLGLKTMSILKKTADIVREAEGVELDYAAVPLDDARTFELLGRGATLGVFQCESSGFQELIKLLKPDRFEDMIALVALYRPGPLMAGMHTDYCDRKHGRAQVDYPHPVLEKSLKETYGLYIYQEQVMSISRELCGFSPAEADDLRKAMGKKDRPALAKLKDHFIAGAERLHAFPRQSCEEMWDKILGFAEYCFNKSHSACYGLIAYWTAWFKANHYPAFMTANLIYEMGNKDKMTEFVEELRGQEIPVLPPDVNESGWEFTLVRRDGEQPAIRYGFGGVKGIGEGASRLLIDERTKHGPYASLYDLCERADTRTLNKRVVEALIKVGAFDSMHANRRSLHEAMERAFDRGQKLASSKADAQQTLFAAFDADSSYRETTQGYPEVPDWSAEQRLGFEKALTGYWISDHPVASWRPQLGSRTTHTARALVEVPDGNKVVVLAVVTGKRMIRTRTGNTMSVLTLEDEQGAFEAVLFGGAGRGRTGPSPCERFADLCEPDTVALFTGTVERRDRSPARPPGGGDDGGRDEAVSTGAEDEDDHGHAAHVDAAPSIPGLVIADVVPAGRATEMLVRSITVAVDASTAGTARLVETEKLLTEHSGDRARVVFSVHTPGGIALTVAPDDRWKVHPSAALIEGLRRIWGEEQVFLELASADRLLAG